MPAATLTQFERDLLKSPRYAGRSVDLQPYFREFPSFGSAGFQRTISSIKRPDKTCTHCAGGRLMLVQHYNGLMTWEKCSICSGTGHYNEIAATEGPRN